MIDKKELIMNAKTVLTYMFKTKSCFFKYLIGALLLIPVSLSNIFSPHNVYTQIIPFIKDIPSEYLQWIYWILFAAGMLLFLFVGGYNVKTLNTRIHKPDAELPEWTDFKSLFICTLKVIAIYLLSSVIIFLVFLILTIINVITVSIFSKAPINILVIISSSVSFIITSLLIAIIIPAAIMAFGTNLQISSFLNGKLILNIVKENKLKYLICVVSCTVLYVISLSISFLSMSKYFWVALIAPFVAYYINLAMIELMASVPRLDKKEYESQTAEE